MSLTLSICALFISIMQSVNTTFFNTLFKYSLSLLIGAKPATAVFSTYIVLITSIYASL